MTASLPAYDVRAVNISAASENKIHDDTVARRFGFRGALVRGVEVFAYTAHGPLAHFRPRVARTRASPRVAFSNPV